MRGQYAQRALIIGGLMLFAGASGYGRNPFSLDEPIVVDPARAYPTVASPPGSPFRPVSYNSSSILDQLAHSSTGIVRLPPGDYSIPVRLY